MLIKDKINNFAFDKINIITKDAVESFTKLPERLLNQMFIAIESKDGNLNIWLA